MMDMKAIFLKPTVEMQTSLKLGRVWGNMRDGDSYRVEDSWYEATDRFHTYQVDELMQSADFRLRIGQKILFMTSGELNLGAGWIQSIQMINRQQINVIERPSVEYVVSLWDVVGKRARSEWAWMIDFQYI